MSSEAQRRATAKYDAKNTTQFHLKLNNGTDADIIEALNKEDKKQTFIKQAIREYMKRNG